MTEHERTTREMAFIEYLDSFPDPLKMPDAPASNALFLVLDYMLADALRDHPPSRGDDLPALVTAIVANLLDAMFTGHVQDPSWIGRYFAALGREHDRECQDIPNCRLRGEMILAWLTWKVP